MKQFVKQTAVCRFASDQCFKDVRVADFLDPPHCSLFFQTIDDCLHSCVGRTLLFGKVFLNLTHRTTPKRPDRTHHFQLQTRQPYLLFFDHPHSLTTNEVEATTIVVELSMEKLGTGKGGRGEKPQLEKRKGQWKD